MFGNCVICRTRSYRLYRLYLTLEHLSGVYDSLLEEFQQKGDIDIFADFDQNLIELRDEIDKLPATDSEERYELTCGVTELSNKLNSLLHSVS